jgi:hypothetical protein
MPLIADLESTRDETLRYFSLGDEDLARTYAPGKWPVRYILQHLTDSETVFYDRIRRVISEPRQVIWWYVPANPVRVFIIVASQSSGLPALSPKRLTPL